MADTYYRVKGPAGRDLHLLWPRLAEPADRARDGVSPVQVPFLLSAATCTNLAVQPRRVSRSCTARKRADFPSTVRSVCKRVFQPTRGEQVPQAVRQAWKTMVTGRPGPVVLDVPFDVFLESAAEETPKPEEWSANISSRCGADPEERDWQGRRYAARGRAAGHPGRPGRKVWRRDGRSPCAR